MTPLLPIHFLNNSELTNSIYNANFLSTFEILFKLRGVRILLVLQKDYLT